jgi:thioredoxin 1
MGCPKDAMKMDMTQNKVVVEAQICGDCPGKCLNYCDTVALKFAPTLIELEVIAREMNGELTSEQAAEERNKIAIQLKAEQAAAEAAKLEKEMAVASAPIKLTTETFVAEVMQAELPVVIDFWAEWCGPCKQIAPIIEELAREFAGKLKFGKLNTDEEPMVAQQLNIQSIPTLMVFFQGQVADMIVGAVPKPQLKQRLQRIVEAVAQLPAAAQAPAPAPTRTTVSEPGPAVPGTAPRPRQVTPTPFRRKK